MWRPFLPFCLKPSVALIIDLMSHCSLGFIAYKAENGGVFLRCGTLSSEPKSITSATLGLRQKGKNGLHRIYFSFQYNKII